MSKFKKCEEDVVEFFNGVLQNDFYMPINTRWVFMTNSKQKTLIKIAKVHEQYQSLLNDAELMAFFNEDYYYSMDDSTRKILIEQELSKLEFNLEKGTIKIGKPNLQTSVSIVKKYTYEEVEKANEVERLFKEQKNDKEKNN